MDNGIGKKEMKVAEKTLSFCCYTGTNMEPFHEIGCPHKKWTVAELLSALKIQKAVVRVLQHKLYGLALDGKPVVIQTKKKA